MGEVNLNIVQMVMDSTFIAKIVILILLFFSIASWTVIIVKFKDIRRALNQSASFIDYFWSSRDLSEVYKRALEPKTGPIGKIFCSGYLEIKKIKEPEKKSKGNIERAFQRTVNSEVSKMMYMVPFLATTGNTAPFIGLFGTVWGIMSSFHSIGMQGSASLAAVAPGISEALVATAAGLAAAIPAVIAFNYFMQKIRIIESEWQSFAADFMNIIQRDILAG